MTENILNRELMDMTNRALAWKKAVEKRGMSIAAQEAVFDICSSYPGEEAIKIRIAGALVTSILETPQRGWSTQRLLDRLNRATIGSSLPQITIDDVFMMTRRPDIDEVDKNLTASISQALLQTSGINYFFRKTVSVCYIFPMPLILNIYGNCVPLKEIRRSALSVTQAITNLRKEAAYA